MELWIAGIAISIILTLIGTIWKSSQKDNDAQDIRIDDLEQQQQQNNQQISQCKSAIESIRENCARHHKNDIGESNIRIMLREELRDFEVRIKQEIISSMKLTLIEEGYITPQTKTARKRNNVAQP